MELIAVAFISGIFMLISISIMNMNWFKKENFKLNRDNIKAENRIKLKKLERDLGFNKNTPVKENTPNNNIFDNISALAPLLQALPPETVADLAEKFLGGGGSDLDDGGALGGLLGFAQENPELIKGILDGIKPKLEGNINKPAEY